MILPFKGYSGCTVEVVQDGESTRIKKSTRDSSYMPRLERQFQKQQRALLLNDLSFIQIPSVTREHRSVDTYGFEMQYFRSEDAISFLQTATLRDIDLVTARLIRFIERNLVHSPALQLERCEIVKKYQSVQEKIANSFVFSEDFIDSLFKQTDAVFAELPEHLTLPVGSCHGDLTLSNVLIAKDSKQMVLVDWLDSFLETPLQDIVKLRQDTQYHWSLNLYNRPFDKTKIMIIMEYIDRRIDNHFRQYEFYKRHYPIFQLLNFLRILPYAEAMHRPYLEQAMGRVLSEKNL